MTDKETRQLICKAIDAVDDEIEAVREQPSQDIFFNGKRQEHHPPEAFYYEFESDNRSIRFAEVIRAELEGTEDPLEVHPVEVEDHKIVLEFPHNLGEAIPRVLLEWENDFVLKCLQRELKFLKDRDRKTERRWVSKLFSPDAQQLHHPSDNTRIVDDGRRNEAQQEALIKANQTEILFVWGPPGTGKTATLGFMMANYLLKGNRVLFASNTNRAVDVGLLSVLQALPAVEKEHLHENMVRFGEIALQNERLEEHHFDQKLQKKKQEKEKEAAGLKKLLDKYQRLQTQAGILVDEDEVVPKELENEINLLEDRVAKFGGEEIMADKIEEMHFINEAAELASCQLVATTLARVCTSDLFNRQQFDAVVIDEASMANLPYLMVLAAKAKQHVVVVGDPMQLPPIALTKVPASRHFLEKDIFTHVSRAESAEDLFAWHDANQLIATFFNTQYRLKSDLANVLSSVFYGGRLKTAADNTNRSSNGTSQDASVYVINTEKYTDFLQQKDGGRGFHPINRVHLKLLVRIVKKLVLKNQVAMNRIGIMVPFRNTVYDVRRILYGNGFGEIEVGTIHTFQGREKEVIIFDTVMIGEKQRGRKRHYSVRPFDEEKNGLAVPRLLNVAFSRSKQKLIILADMEHINKIYQKKYLGRLLTKFQDL